MSSVKESYFHCSDILKDCDDRGIGEFYKVRTCSEYEKLFEGASKSQILGESSVFYAISEDAIQNIKHANQNAKIIIILRDPVELVDSWFNYLQLHGRENATCLEQALELQEKRQLGENWPQNTQAAIHLQYDNLVNFPTHLNRIFKYFDREAIHFIFYDDFKANCRSSVADVFSFLGVDPAFIPDFTMQNVSRKIKHGKAKAFVDRYKRSGMRTLKQLHLLSAGKGLHKLYSRMFTIEETRPSVSTDRRSRLVDRYKAMLSETSHIIGIDLINKWNF